MNCPKCKDSGHVGITTEPIYPIPCDECSCGNLTLRREYAKAAMQALVISGYGGGDTWVAVKAFSIADAMIKEGE